MITFELSELDAQLLLFACTFTSVHADGDPQRVQKVLIDTMKKHPDRFKTRLDALCKEMSRQVVAQVPGAEEQFKEYAKLGWNVFEERSAL